MKIGSLDRQVAKQVKSRLDAEQLDGGVKTEEMKPQISPMNADLISNPTVKKSLTVQSVAKVRSLR